MQSSLRDSDGRRCRRAWRCFWITPHGPALAVGSSADMFDKTKSGRIDIFAFSALWRFIQQWKNLFQQYDRDRSGSISFSELQQGETRGDVADCREQAGGSILRHDSTVPIVVPVPTSCSLKPYGVCSGGSPQTCMTTASGASVQGKGGRINSSVLAWLPPTLNNYICPLLQCNSYILNSWNRCVMNALCSLSFKRAPWKWCS